MSHNLSTFTDEHGKTRHCMMSLRENPWHGLGQVIQAPVGSNEAIKLSGLDWSVELRHLYTDGLHPVPEHRAVVRSDTSAVLGVVKRNYTPVQNAALFAWLESLGGDSGIVIETAGALGQGETVWILARMPEEIRVGRDLTQAYMLVYQGMASNRMLVCAPVGRRVVCANTLSLATAEIRNNRGKKQLEAGFRIRHTVGVRRALDDVAAAYRITRASIEATRYAYQHLARVPMTEGMIDTMLARAFAGDLPAGTEADRAAVIRKSREEKIRAILASPTCTGEDVNGSAFALLNSITEFVDHERSTRTREGQNTGTQRFASAVWGSGSLIKTAAWDAIIELAHA